MSPIVEQVPKTHTWSGRRYKLHKVKTQKRHADNEVKYLQRQGYYAIKRRVHLKREGKVWAIYKREKRI